MIRNEEKQVELVERRKLIEIQESEIERKEKDLFCAVNLPTESEAYKLSMEATGNRNAKIALAEAEAMRIRLIGEAEVWWRDNLECSIKMTFTLSLIVEAN